MRVNTYLVTSPKEIVVVDGQTAISYPPGARFQADPNNASIQLLVYRGDIGLVTSVVPPPPPAPPSDIPAPGQGPQGPVGPAGPTGPAGPPTITKALLTKGQLGNDRLYKAFAFCLYNDLQNGDVINITTDTDGTLTLTAGIDFVVSGDTLQTMLQLEPLINAGIPSLKTLICELRTFFSTPPSSGLALVIMDRNTNSYDVERNLRIWGNITTPSDLVILDYHNTADYSRGSAVERNLSLTDPLTGMCGYTVWWEPLNQASTLHIGNNFYVQCESQPSNYGHWSMGQRIAGTIGCLAHFTGAYIPNVFGQHGWSCNVPSSSSGDILTDSNGTIFETTLITPPYGRQLELGSSNPGLGGGISIWGPIGLNGQAPTAQGPDIPNAAGGVVIDVEARAALNSLLAYLRLRGDINNPPA